MDCEVCGVGENKKWRMDYSDYPELDQGLPGAVETVGHVVLALCVLYGVYVFC